jgi:hypothetical protein
LDAGTDFGEFMRAFKDEGTETRAGERDRGG